MMMFTPSSSSYLEPKSPLSQCNYKEYFFWMIGYRFRFQIRGISMKPTLDHGDLILVDPSAYDVIDPHLGDLVLVVHPYEKDRQMVKRITQMSKRDGQTRYHVEGDNSKESTDSRSFGSLSRSQIFGKITARF